jgi:hypothetical protein
VAVTGDTVRIVTQDRRLAIGRLIAQSRDSLYVDGSSGTYHVGIATVRSLHVQRGSHAGDLRFLNHIVGGAIVGTFAWFLAASVIECGGGRCAGGEGSYVAVYGSPVGLLAGAIIGGVSAHRNPVPRWIPAVADHD